MKLSSSLKIPATPLNYDENLVKNINFRPLISRKYYAEKALSDRLTENHFVMFGSSLCLSNPTLLFTEPASQKEFTAGASERLFDYHYVGAAASAIGIPLYRYTPTGERIDNITDWALKRFRDHYGKDAGVTRDAIFTYVYGVLHDPIYRETYAINLKREFPRIPFHPDFRRWSEWGARLMDLHIGYETVDPWPLKRHDVPDARARAAGQSPKVILKSDAAAGTITLDSETRLTGLPAVAWTYRLGNRSGLDWVLDQHKEKTPKDPTIRARFNTYRFKDHKERVIDLLARVARVSVETMEIVEAMRSAPRDPG